MSSNGSKVPYPPLCMCEWNFCCISKIYRKCKCKWYLTRTSSITAPNNPNKTQISSGKAHLMTIPWLLCMCLRMEFLPYPNDIQKKLAIVDWVTWIKLAELLSFLIKNFSYILMKSLSNWWQNCHCNRIFVTLTAWNLLVMVLVSLKVSL